MKNCLITGANGFVGRNLCAHLELREDINLLKYDINNTMGELRTFLEQADFVFHLAGVNRPKEESEFKEGNAGLTQDIVDILGSLDKKIPVLLTSSTQAELDNPYGKSKKEAEDIILSYGGKMYARVYRFPEPLRQVVPAQLQQRGRHILPQHRARSADHDKRREPSSDFVLHR